MTSISAVEMARRIRYGEITSTRLIEAHLSRIHELNGQLQAIVTESATAMEEAAAADRLYETIFDGALEATVLEAEVDVAEPSHIEEARRRVAEGEVLPHLAFSRGRAESKFWASVCCRVGKGRR